MKSKKKFISKSKLTVALILFVFLFSIFKVGKSLASTDSFKINNVEITDKSESTEVNNISFEKTKITNDVTFHKVGDSVTYKVTVKNNDNTNYTIKSVSDDNTNEYVSYIYDSYEGVKILANGEATFNVTAKYAKELTDVTKKDQSFSVNINFILEDENGNVKSTNPKTDDNITMYLITAAASSVMLLIILRKNMLVKVGRKKSHSSRGKKSGRHSDRGMKFFSIILALVVIFPTMARVSKAASNSLVLTFENTYRLYNVPSDISINVTDEDEWKPSKTVTIDYNTTYTSNEYTIQYSTDDGQTWQNYTGPITINENNTPIKARVLLNDTNEVVDSTEKTVAKIDPVMPTVAITLGDRYYSGQELDLSTVTTATAGESGYTLKWYIDDLEITNLSETNKIDKMDSEYQIKVKAVVTTGAGLEAEAYSGTIIVQYALWQDYLVGPLTRDNIQTIKFGSWANRPTNATGEADISYNDVGTVFEYYTLDPDTNLYDVYITSPYGYTRYYNTDMRIYIGDETNENMSRGLFSYLSKMTSIDFEYLDMYNITNTAHLFDMIDYSTDFWECNSSLKSITWGEKFNTINVTDMSEMFAGLDKLESINLESFDTRNVKNMYGMFARCEKLETIEVSTWDTSNVTHMGTLFYQTKSLKNLDVSNWNTSNVTKMFQVFYESGIENLDLSRWDTSKVTTMREIFCNATSLKELNISGWQTSNVTDMSFMFYGCSSLTELDLSSFDTSNVTTMYLMFYNCNKLTKVDFRHLDLSNVSDLRYMFYRASKLEKVYVEAIPTYKSGAQTTNMWTSAGTNKFTVKEYDD